MEPQTIKTPILFRELDIAKKTIDEEKRSVAISFSSELPVDRYFGVEVLDHSPKSVDMEFMKSGRAPLLLEHARDKQIGVVEKATIDRDRVGRAVVRFGKSDQAESIFRDVVDGIRSNISVGYQIKRMKIDEANDGKKDTYRVVDWRPLEISFVSIPADTSVGLGRQADESEEFDTIVEGNRNLNLNDEKGDDMSDKNKTTGDPVDDKRNEPEVAPVKIEGISDADREAIRVQAENEAKTRASDILFIGDTHGFQSEAAEAIREGKSVEAFRAFVLDKLKERNLQPVDNPSPEIGLTDKEKRSFSFVKMIRSLADPGNRALYEDAAFEFECSRAAVDQYKVQPKGVMVPHDVLLSGQRDINTSDDSAMIGTAHLAASFIDVLRARLVVRQAGAFVLDGLVGNVAIPKKTGAASVYWVAEGVAPTESEASFGSVTLSPKTCGTFTDVTRTMLLQSTPGIEQIVRADLAGSIAAGIDIAGLHGTGANDQPTGVAATSGIGSVAGGTNGLAPSDDHIIDLETAVATANADIGALSYITNAKVRGKLKKTDIGTDTGLRVWDRVSGNTPLNGYRAFVTNNVASDLDKGTSTGVCSAIFFGNWSDLIIGSWAGLDILVDPYSQSSTGNVRIRAFQSVDIGVRHAGSFAAMLDALTA